MRSLKLQARSNASKSGTLSLNMDTPPPNGMPSNTTRRRPQKPAINVCLIARGKLILCATDMTERMIGRITELIDVAGFGRCRIRTLQDSDAAGFADVGNIFA